MKGASTPAGEGIPSTADPLKGLEIVQQESVSLVLLDFMMPVLNALDFLRILRSERTLWHLPVLMLASTTATRLRASARST